MRYILNISPEDAVARLRFALLGTIAESLNYTWKPDPKTGMYGSVSSDCFEIGVLDAPISPHPMRLLHARLKGAIREAPEGSVLDVRFCSSPLVYLMLAMFFCCDVLGALINIYKMEFPGTRFLIALGGLAACIFLVSLLHIAKKRNYRELEQVLSGCIVEKQQ